MLLALTVICFAAAATLFYVNYLRNREDYVPRPQREWNQGMLEKVQYFLRRAGFLETTPSFFFLILFTIALGIGIVILFVTRNPWLMLISLPLTAIGAYFYLIIKERQFLKKASLEMVPFLTRMESAVGSGTNAQTAFLESVEQTKLIKHALQGPIRRMYLQEPLLDVLNDTPKLLPTRSWEQFVRTMNMQNRRGGKMEDILRDAVDQINTLMELQAELKADYSRVQNEQLMILVMCALILPAMHYFMGGLITPLFTTFAGIVGFLFGLLLILGGAAFGQKNVRDIEKKLDF